MSYSNMRNWYNYIVDATACSRSRLDFFYYIRRKGARCSTTLTAIIFSGCLLGCTSGRPLAGDLPVQVGQGTAGAGRAASWLFTI
jgi:hypothetical protein